jgi:hypothetical protein
VAEVLELGDEVLERASAGVRRFGSYSVPFAEAKGTL